MKEDILILCLCGLRIELKLITILFNGMIRQTSVLSMITCVALRLHQMMFVQFNSINILLKIIWCECTYKLLQYHFCDTTRLIKYLSQPMSTDAYVWSDFYGLIFTADVSIRFWNCILLTELNADSNVSIADAANYF